MRAAIRQSYEAREAAELESRAVEAKNYLDILKSLDGQTRRAAAEVSTNLILRWIKKELHKNVLSKVEAEELLQWARLREAFSGADDTLPKSVNLDALPTNIINQLCSVLFGAQKPIENEIWERWFSSLKAWLQPDRTPSRYQRLTVLKEVQIQAAEKSFLLHQEIRVSVPEVVNEYELLTCQWQCAGAIKLLGVQRRRTS
ncbi:hypothetical protein OEA41_010708 [Lepraria neglecta]|uniref:Uncharacterized protein n=1 Tax=Lepraria neglecta TaxID=209136 RepID=A0AAD9YX52_9LECA|nr:hypothetical protein OEA41_010708 [Lepraria neglecta]